MSLANRRGVEPSRGGKTAGGEELGQRIQHDQRLTRVGRALLMGANDVVWCQCHAHAAQRTDGT